MAVAQRELFKVASKTKSFGTPQRVKHDASEFYRRKLFEEKEDQRDYREQALPEGYAYQVFEEDATAPVKHRLADESVHLIVTSPPYCVGKDYDDDLTLDEFLDVLNGVWQESLRVLVHGGRICVNVANIGRKPYIPLSSHITQQMLALGFLMRGEIIWTKPGSAGSCAWGSWKSASNPCLRDIHEYILVFSKGTNKRPKVEGRESTMGKDAFMEYTHSVWTMPPESAKRVGHPAPFPVELPKRCIELYTYDSEVVFDPFAGSGTTGIAAMDTGRIFVGYDKDAKYVALANNRLKSHLEVCDG